MKSISKWRKIKMKHPYKMTMKEFKKWDKDCWNRASSEGKSMLNTLKAPFFSQEDKKQGWRLYKQSYLKI